MIASLTSLFAAIPTCSKPTFFGLKPWHQYLQYQYVPNRPPITGGSCEITNFHVLGGTSGSDFVLIGLVIVDDLLRIAGFVTIGYIIYGGILYVTSQGSPEQTGKAQSTIQNGLIGLAIAIIAVAFVTFLGARIG